jgi:hypothetical protein
MRTQVRRQYLNLLLRRRRCCCCNSRARCSLPLTYRDDKNIRMLEAHCVYPIFCAVPWWKVKEFCSVFFCTLNSFLLSAAQLFIWRNHSYFHSCCVCLWLACQEISLFLCVIIQSRWIWQICIFSHTRHDSFYVWF